MTKIDTAVLSAALLAVGCLFLLFGDMKMATMVGALGVTLAVVAVWRGR